MVKADGKFSFCVFSHNGELSEGVPGRVRHRPGQDAADAPHPPRPRAQLLGLPVRGAEPAVGRVHARQGGLRRRDRRARHARRGVVQGLDAHHAAPQGQPHALDVGHAGRR